MEKRHARELIDELCDYLGYDIGSPMCKELHQHINSCKDCQDYIETVNVTVKICQDSNPEKPCPDDIKNKLLASLPFNKKKANSQD
ncbi:MAG: hypothetical protein KDI06_14850 [Calditrichaeota bacterium]|nr:hypothetical protein [Calditrichota bacterium]HQU71215.1 hypothetical protein [Calditrichia bacterium]